MKEVDRQAHQTSDHCEQSILDFGEQLFTLVFNTKHTHYLQGVAD